MPNDSTLASDSLSAPQQEATAPTMVDVALLDKIARDYEASAEACDSPNLERYRRERTRIAKDVRDLRRRLAATIHERLAALKSLEASQ